MEASTAIETMPATTKRKFSLQELAVHFEQTKKLSEESGSSDESDDIQEIYLAAKGLLEGKLDRAVKLKQGLEAHTEACKKQIEYNQWAAGQIQSMIEEAVLLTELKRIDGLACHAKMKKNPPAVSIINAEEVPSEYKNYEFSASDKFPIDDVAKFCKYASFVLGRTITSKMDLTPIEAETLSDYFDQTIDKRKLSSDLKKSNVSGAVLVQGEKLDIQVGKSALKGAL